MTLSPGQRLGTFEILGALGVGGMGEVYRARDTKLGREVAIKVLPDEISQDRERMARFEREAKLLAALNHPSVATLYGLEEHGGRPFLVMELVEGETLAERIARRPLRVDEVLSLFESIADGLEAAHEKGIVHRDLKPSNVKVTPEGKVKILDFGLAKLAESELSPADDAVSRSPTLTRGTAMGVILGTASYMSPEQARGATVDRRTDIWAFGCCLYETLTGRKAFDGDTVTDVLAGIVKNEPAWESLPRETPSAVRRLLRRCLEKSARERLRDIGDARLEIRETRAQPGEVEAQHSRFRVVSVLAAATAIGFVAWSIFDRPRPTVNVDGRFEIGLPPGAQLVGHFTNPLALSPDGTRLVFAAAVGDRPPELYLRNIDSFESTRLSGTEEATSPFFSPDGNWVAFFAGARLKKVSVSGGAPLDVGEVLGVQRAGTWAEDDTIIVGDALSGGLLRVQASGGVAERLTEPDVGQGEANHSWPQILPDGKTVLFTITGDRLHSAFLSLDTGRWRRIFAGEEPSAVARYSPSGHLLMPNSGGLVAIPLDSERLTPDGQRVSILDDVYTAVTGASWFAVSSVGTMVYVPGTRELNRLVWVNRQGESTPAIPDVGDFWNPRLSPDGKRVAVSIHSGIRSDLWIYDLEREARIRLTASGKNNLFPVWSPDGRQIAFAANRSGVFNPYLVASDGSGEPEPLGTKEIAGGVSSWSMDGRFLAFYSVPEMDQFVMPLDGDRRPTPFATTPYGEISGMFSPDSRFLAYVSNETGRFEVYVQPFPGPGEKIPISSNGGRAPVWSRDGRELFYRNGNDMMAVSIVSEPAFRAGRPRKLFDGRYAVEPGGQHDYDVSPDGERFLMIAVDEPSAPNEMRVVLDWFEELSKLAPVP